MSYFPNYWNLRKNKRKDRNQVTRNWLYLINKKYHIHYEEINTKIKINKDK